MAYLPPSHAQEHSSSVGGKWWKLGEHGRGCGTGSGHVLYVQYTVCIYLFGILLLKMVHFNFPASCKPFRLWKHQEDCDWPVKTKIKYKKKIIGSVCGCP